MQGLASAHSVNVAALSVSSMASRRAFGLAFRVKRLQLTRVMCSQVLRCVRARPQPTRRAVQWASGLPKRSRAHSRSSCTGMEPSLSPPRSHSLSLLVDSSFLAPGSWTASHGPRRVLAFLTPTRCRFGAGGAQGRPTFPAAQLLLLGHGQLKAAMPSRPCWEGSITMCRITDADGRLVQQPLPIIYPWHAPWNVWLPPSLQCSVRCNQAVLTWQVLGVGCP